MHDDGMGSVFYLRESVYQGGNIVPIFHVNIIKSERFEKIARRLAVRVPQGFQVLVQTAMILGNRHFIVINDHDQVGACFRGIA